MQEQKQYDDSVNLVDYLIVIYRYRFLVLLAVLSTMFFTGLSAVRQPRVYEATTTFFPMDVRNYLSMVDIEKSQGLGRSRTMDIDNLVVPILESRKMADKIIEQLDLTKAWGTNSITAARRTLKGASKISMGKNGIIKLSVQDTSPELSAKIANAYVDNLEYFNTEFNVGAERDLVQVIDRAVIPDETLPRKVSRKVMMKGFGALIVSIFLSFFINFARSANLAQRLRQGR